MKGLIYETQLGDIKLAICRNVGDGYIKRKISWQDPAPLRSIYIELQHKEPEGLQKENTMKGYRFEGLVINASVSFSYLLCIS